MTDAGFMEIQKGNLSHEKIRGISGVFFRRELAIFYLQSNQNKIPVIINRDLSQIDNASRIRNNPVLFCMYPNISWYPGDGRSTIYLCR
ncbi:MAG: hypothetical protein CVV33_01780 [Methanomicrobiales archaeon HGW-Methanomicrobiales-4]|nr:MAG: hypothetical protein CVV33_01780 [Methanomicrobiales archaeon HGW-Methanomicrobiales-4]